MTERQSQAIASRCIPDITSAATENIESSSANQAVLQYEQRIGTTWTASLGYEHYVFFTNRGEVHVECEAPTKTLLRSLIELSRARSATDGLHWDVLAGTTEVCQRVVASSLARLARRTACK